VQCRIPGFDYVSAGNSTSKKDAQTNAAKDMVQYLVRIGRISPSEVPTFVTVCIDNILLFPVLLKHRIRAPYLSVCEQDL